MRVALVDDNKNDLALLHEYISEQTAHSCQIDTFFKRRKLFVMLADGSL